MADSGSDENPPLRSQTAVFCLCPPLAEKATEPLGVSFIRVLIPFLSRGPRGMTLTPGLPAS